MYRATPREGIAFISGASSGIGRATALELAKRGYRVAVTARRADELKRFAESLPQLIFAYPGDVTQRAEMAALVAKVEADLGPIALAFLNAGVFLPAERQGFDAAAIAQTHAVNVGGVVNCLDPILAGMTKNGRGQIALNASIAGYNGLPGSLAYGSSKAALINLAEGLRLTYADKGITIQLVCHGFVRTPMTDQEKDYAMPLLIEADAAARLICDGFERGGFEISFPWQLVALSKFIRVLPYPLKFRLMEMSLHHAKRQS